MSRARTLSKKANTNLELSEDGIFRLHANTLMSNTTISIDRNALAAGPLTVANGVILTINGNLTVT